MKISFFEEFPNKESISKLKLVKFKTKLYIAEYHIEGFKQYKKEIKNVELIWWPILNYADGYWLSPFTKRKAIIKLSHQLKDNMPLLWDAELPKNRKLIITQIFKFFTNRKIIRDFFKTYKGQIYTAEYALEKGVLKRILNFLGLSFDPKEYGNKIIRMFYTSLHDYPEEFLEKEIKNGVEKYSDKFLVGLGCIAIGINGNEPLLKPEQLKRDLELCKKLGVKEVVIFRLGGLNKEYIKVINKYC